ncbi:triadin-like [Pogona vitticeps]
MTFLLQLKRELVNRAKIWFLLVLKNFDSEAVKPKEVKPTIPQKQKAPEVIKETKDTSHRAIAGKREEHKPLRQEVLKHDKGAPQGKPEEITVADKKKAEKPLKEKDRKIAAVTHLKEEKAKVPAVKESHHHRNMTTDKLSKASKATAAVRYYQCVFVNGYNDYKPQHPVTPAQDYKGKAGQTKTSGHKIKTLKQ